MIQCVNIDTLASSVADLNVAQTKQHRADRHRRDEHMREVIAEKKKNQFGRRRDVKWNSYAHNSYVKVGTRRGERA